MIIVIDGPAGSGKSSTARAVAKELNIQYLDSGALYRALTFLYLSEQTDQHTFFDSFEKIQLEFLYENEIFRVWLNQKEITSDIRGMNISNMVSHIAGNPKARAFVNLLMKKAVAKGKYVAEGRDLGTAVFPDADMKFFMIADVETRAKRRYKELKEKGADASFEEILKNIEERDILDSNRKADPLKQADDAILIDTSGLTFEDQVAQIVAKASQVVQN